MGISIDGFTSIYYQRIFANGHELENRKINSCNAVNSVAIKKLLRCNNSYLVFLLPQKSRKGTEGNGVKNFSGLKYILETWPIIGKISG